jgi:hypothetical protein
MFSCLLHRLIHLRAIAAFVGLATAPLLTFADEDYATVSVQMANRVYRSSIKTVELHPQDAEMQAPIYELGSDIRLFLAFDDLDGDVKNFTYTFVHCDFNWNPSNLMPLDYLSGFPEDQITSWTNSYNTSPQYTHYKLFFPGPNITITKSGNYVLKVCEDNNPDKPVLTRRFFVVEKRVFINANCHAATAVADRSYKQEVDFEISFGDYPVQNPIDDIMVAILQNQRFDNALTTLKPMYVKNNLITYDYDDQNVFNGGSEFREMDIKNLQMTSLRVNYINRDEKKQWHVYMQNDENKAFKRYSSMRDINGQFVVRTMQGDPATEADYAMVHFSLPCDKPVASGEVYVVGAFSGFVCLPEYRMTFDATAGMYRGQALFKQGYYNYRYVVKNPGDDPYDETVFEGNRFETENSYLIFVYNRGIGFFYDKLVGVTQIFSNSFSR